MKQKGGGDPPLFVSSLPSPSRVPPGQTGMSLSFFFFSGKYPRKIREIPIAMVFDQV
jgi:hypothetical protein